MPRIVHCAGWGANKATIAALKPGESVERPSYKSAYALRAAARAMGLRVRVRQLARGRPEHRLTLIGPRGATAPQVSGFSPQVSSP